MGFYSKIVFPLIYDCVIDQPFLNEYRKQQLADVSGEILEIGVGTGLNLPRYPQHVRRITTVDPNPGMNRKLEKQIARTGIEVDQRIIGSEELPFAESTFDTIVSTLTLCSIASVSQAISELYRVLKPDGRFHFFEHGLSPDSAVQKRQRRWNWLESLIADGCRLDLNVPGLFEAHPFASVEIENFYVQQIPKTHGYIYRGVATK